MSRTFATRSATCFASTAPRSQPHAKVLKRSPVPDKTGYDVFAFARKKWETVPVVLMTGFGYDPNHSIVRATHEGLQAVLFKPFRVEKLLAEVRKALQSQAVN